MSGDDISEGQYQEGLTDPSPPEEAPKPGTIGELAANIKRQGLIGLSCALTLLQGDAQDDSELAEAYKACWLALNPYAQREGDKLQQIVEAYGPDGIADAPASLHSVAWKRVRWGGNLPLVEVIFGWRVRLGRHTKAEEKVWLKAHGFEFSGGWWGRPDGGFHAR